MGAPDTGHRGLPAHTHGCARQTRAPRGAGGAGEPRGSTPRVKRRRGVTAKSRKGGAGVSPSARPDGGGHGCPWPARCGWGGPGSGAGGAPVTAALQEVAPARGPQPHPGAGSLAGGSRGGTRSRGGTAAPRCLASTGSARPAVPRSPPWRGASRSLAPRGLRGRGARSGTFPASGCTGDPRRGLGFSHLYSRGAGSARYTTRKIFLFFLMGTKGPSLAHRSPRLLAADAQLPPMCQSELVPRRATRGFRTEAVPWKTTSRLGNVFAAHSLPWEPHGVSSLTNFLYSFMLKKMRELSLNCERLFQDEF
ncbi:translation initiation factor IF-2-like isoform X2 [Tyto alba]|uniref:translation initiation factor IF-2-like isoform X2 n=1 Tax=Tyto alba TaxID=56313 RepID=UPI001C678D4B|nr:translation initiation factor IF-2-like isoform X2 [Tyto alba]